MEELARIFHESLAATTDMAVLPGVLGCRPLRRTIQVRLGTNTLRLPGTRRKRLRCAWQAHLRGLATAIHEISGLIRCTIYYELFVPAQYAPVAATTIDNFRYESGGIFLSIRYTRLVCLQRQ